MRRGTSTGVDRAAARLIGRRLGASSFGTVRSDELRDATVHPSVTARLVALGEWQLLWRGMYLCASHPPNALVRAAAALKHAAQRRIDARTQPDPVRTGLAGAAALKLRWVPEHTRVQVLVGPEVRRSSNDGVLVRRTWDLTQIETWNWAKMPVADATRLVVDGARECLSLRDVRGLALGAAADGYTDAPALRALLDAGAVGGSAWLRRAVVDIERGAASPPEAEVIDGLVGRGRPFVVNRQVWIGELFVGRLDGYLLGTGVGYEVDSKERHGSSSNMDSTLQRHERASRGGALSLVHVTPSSYRADPHGFFSRLEAEVGYRQKAGLGEPPGFRLGPGGPVLC